MSNDELLRFPIGKHTSKESYTPAEVTQLINRIEALPAAVEAIVGSLNSAQLQTSYRDGGWTALQVVHHLSDSHVNAYVRIKLLLTEETPTIKPYDEKAWALTPEVAGDPAMSVALLKALHQKWVALVRTIPAHSFSRQYFHPESKKHTRLDQAIALYAWHGEHHLGHLKIAAGK